MQLHQREEKTPVQLEVPKKGEAEGTPEVHGLLHELFQDVQESRLVRSELRGWKLPAQSLAHSR